MNHKFAALLLLVGAGLLSRARAQDACSAKLAELCPAQPQACLQCAVGERSEALLGAGCDADSVAALCANGAGNEASCSATVAELCPTTTTLVARQQTGSSTTPCLQCVQENRNALENSGCTRGLVRSICSNGPSSSAVPASAADCVAAFETVCPSESSLNGQNCARCAQTNKEDLLTAGCTLGMVTRICKGETQAEDDVYDPSNFKLPVPETILPTGATDENPLRVFVLAGQSGAQGQASVEGLELERYADLRGPQENVWFSSLQAGRGAPVERFYMGPMIPGDASDTGLKFGPEVSIGKRLMDARGGPGNSAPVLVIKYAWGGSNLAKQWNPTADANSWDREADDGTAAWLVDNGVTDMTSKNHLYANMMYTIRKSLETLEEGSVPYELEGMFWLQGSADKKRTWQEYGADTITFFEQIRADLDAPGLAIVDMGGGNNHNIQTAKQYAASVLEGCNHVVARMAMGAADPDSDCVSGAGKACEEGFRNYDLFDFYGYDPVMAQPEYAGFLKPGTTIEKEFAWFKSFPTNNHMDYDGKILQGRMMANMFVQSFTDDELTDEWLAEDVQALFPMDACDPSVNDGKPSEDNICWMDLRQEADFAEATCMMNGLELFDSMGEMTIMKLTISAGSRVGSTAVLALASSALLWLLV